MSDYAPGIQLHAGVCPGNGAANDQGRTYRLLRTTDDPADEGKFRTPALRNIALTAPYMHDGAIKTLEEVITRHYAREGLATTGGKPANPLRSSLIAGSASARRRCRI